MEFEQTCLYNFSSMFKYHSFAFIPVVFFQKMDVNGGVLG